MAEVAGTIVGVISLSLQLYDKLSEYTNGVKDAKKKAEQITLELDTLVNLLEHLETATSRMDPTTPIALVKAIIQQCALSIESIRTKVGDDTPSTNSSRFSTQSRKVMKRLAYPFKETDIKYWRDALSSIRQNLQIALQALEMDRWQQSFATVQGQLGQLSLNTQMILDQQQRVQTPPNHYLIDQSRSSSADLTTSRRHLVSIQSFVGQHDHAFAQDPPIGVHFPSPPASWPPNVLSDALLPMSAVSLEQETANFQHLQRRTQYTRSRITRNSNTSRSCTCREYHRKKQVVQLPFFVSRSETRFHDPSCPFWIAGSRDMTLSFGMILCYLILGLKIRLFVKLSVGSGTFSILPTLSFRRIVTVESSPAFSLIANMLSRYNVDGVETLNYSAELTNIFHTRQASPHERLEDGRTLLHYLCQWISGTAVDMSPSSVDICQLLLKQLLGYMTYADASDTDDSGRTCVDLLLRNSRQLLTYKSGFKILASDLLRYDLRISRAIEFAESYSSWVEISFTSFPDPFSGLSNTTVAALLRSDMDFSIAIQTQISNQLWQKGEVSDLYHMITLMGWVPGCQILLDAGLSYTSDAPRDSPLDLLLLDAVDSQSQSMVQFWLDVRENATAECLANIGGLEVAVVHAFAGSKVNIAETVAAHLIEQRQKLRQAIETYGVGCECVKRSRDVLDAHATCATHALDRIGLKIPPSLRPTSVNIYNDSTIYNQYRQHDANFSLISPLKILQFLYDTGFKDVAIVDKECCRDMDCSPLFLGIASWVETRKISGEIPEFFGMIDWFLGKGADITDCWPGSKITALHCISYKAADLIFLNELAIMDEFCDIIANPSRHAVTDDCKCSCSTHGCTSIAPFFRYEHWCSTSEEWEGILGLLRLEHVVDDDQDAYQKCRMSLQCVPGASKDAANRWIITNFIRLCIFSWLGIRHACCDLSEFMESLHYAMEPDLQRAPRPRYPPDKLRRIQEEDAYLVRLLEDLVPLFDARYDSHDGDLLSFVDDVLVPEMNIVLGRLKQEDEVTHAAGRRAMGVIMVDEGEHGLIEEDESESLDEVESDAVDE